MYFNGHHFLLNFGDKLVTVFLKKIKKKCLVRCVGGGVPMWACSVAHGRHQAHLGVPRSLARPVWHAAAAVCCGGASGAADGGAGLQLPRRWRGCGSPWWQRGQQGVAWRWRRERGRGVAAVSSVRWAVAGSWSARVFTSPFKACAPGGWAWYLWAGMHFVFNFQNLKLVLIRWQIKFDTKTFGWPFSDTEFLKSATKIQLGAFIFETKK